MRTIAIVNEKGGTGKTTTAVNLSAALGELGQRVLLVDLDGQAASSRWLGVEEDHRLADALIRGGGLEPIKGVAPGVSLAPASGKLDSVSHELRATQGGQLRRILAPLQEQYDYALIDCPPSLGNRLIGNALLAATHAIVPVEPSILALDGLRILLTTLDDVRDGFDHPIELIGVLACRYESRTRLSKLILAELHRALPGKVFRTVIRETVRMQECPASGSSILEFADKNNAATDYRQLAGELLAGGPLPGNAAVAAQTFGVEEAEDVDLAEQDRMTIESFRRQARASVNRTVPGKQAGEQTPVQDPAAMRVEAPASADVPAETVKAGAVAAEDKPSPPAPVTVEAKAQAVAPPCTPAQSPVQAPAQSPAKPSRPCTAATPAPAMPGQARQQVAPLACPAPSASIAARPEPAKAVAAATAAHAKPAPEAYRPLLDMSQWRADNDTSDSREGPRISPARQPRQTRKGLLVGAAAACLALGTWATVRLSQDTPQAAAGADHGSGLVMHRANRAPAPAAMAMTADGADNATALDEQVEANMGEPSGPVVDTRGFMGAPMSPADAPASMPEELPMSDAPTTMPASDAAAAMPADLAEQAAAQSPTTMPAAPASGGIQPSDGAGKAATASPATRPADPAFRMAPSGYSLGAIMRGANGNLAVINGKPVGEGAVVRGAKVIQIQPLSVELELDGQRFTVGLGRQPDRAPAAAPQRRAAK